MFQGVVETSHTLLGCQNLYVSGSTFDHAFDNIILESSMKLISFVVALSVSSQTTNGISSRRDCFFVSAVDTDYQLSSPTPLPSPSPPQHNKRSTNQPKVIQYNMSTAEGCYLSFHADSGGRLELQYSKRSVEKGMHHSDIHIHPTNCLTLQRSLQQSRFGELEKERRYKGSSSIKTRVDKSLSKVLLEGTPTRRSTTLDVVNI